LFAAAIHNRIQDTLERCRDLVGTYSASIIIITLSAGIIIIINPHGEDQKLDQDVSPLAELQTVKISSGIRAPANNRQHSGAPPIHRRLFSSIQSSNKPLASAAGDCKKDPRWHPCKMIWTRRETIKVYSWNYSEQNVNKKPKYLLKETLRKVLLRTHKTGSLTGTEKQGWFSWAYSVAQSTHLVVLLQCGL
jgi:hypothetical protein